MELQQLEIEPRDLRGKGPARRARVTGRIPAVVYGEGKDAASISVDEKALAHVLHGRGGEHAVLQLEAADAPELNGPVIVKAVQHHPVTDHVLSCDFLRIKLDERIQTVTPVVLIGRSHGVVNEGGVADHQLRELEIECLALDTPEHIEVDITELHINDSLHVESITPPKGVTILTEGERAIVSIQPPRIVTEEEEADEEAPTEPEVIGESSEDKEE